MRTAIRNSGGIRGSLLIPEAPFELLVRRAIGRLLAPALQCKEFVHAELLRVAAQCAPPDLGRFPVLQASWGGEMWVPCRVGLPHSSALPTGPAALHHLPTCPSTQSVLAEAVEDLIAQGAAPAEAMIRNLVLCELAYINTSHPGFVGGNRAIAQVSARQAAWPGRQAAGRCAGGGAG